MPEFTPEMARDAIKVVLMGYLSAETNQTATIEDLMKIYNAKGLKIYWKICFLPFKITMVPFELKM